MTVISSSVAPGEGAALDPERLRLQEARDKNAPWYRWGSYLSERQWGTVREDYSANGDAWNYFTNEMATYRTYRWGEDGLLGICDESGSLCFGLALWNGVDPILKERPFGLSNPQGNHGEDVKEYYYFLDNTPTHSYMRALYKYPQRAFPYDDLITTNRARSHADPEYELLDTGVFADDRYFDVVVEYAKAGPEDILIRVSATNRGPDAAVLHLLPTLWFRNTWVWGRDERKPGLTEVPGPAGTRVIRADHHDLGTYWLVCDGDPDLLFTNNETNAQRLYGGQNISSYVKDGIHRAVINLEHTAVDPANVGTKAAPQYVLDIASGDTACVVLRLAGGDSAPSLSGASDVFSIRQAEADQFYAPLTTGVPEECRPIVRQALAGMLWSKQYYNYDIRVWLEGDPKEPTPPAQRREGRNSDWWTLNNKEVISMPDTWEYPWYASWDLAFQCVPMALVDATFAKGQLILLMREWYMKPDGQIPAYEWSFGQVNPPVHAWAALKVYTIEKSRTGTGDRTFLERVFHKLMVNFTWWVNRKDPAGHNVFEAGFLGLDNIGIFDRDAPLPTGGYLQEADATAWMGMFCLNMLDIALELAVEDNVYEDIATKFFEHFMYIAGALNNIGGDGPELWDQGDQFFYDTIRLPDGQSLPLKIRSLVGLIPICAVLTIEPETLQRLPGFCKRMAWFLDHHPDLAALVSTLTTPGKGDTHLLALAHSDRLMSLLKPMLDPEEFLSDHGIRSLSKFHLDHPYVYDVGGLHYSVSYDPGPSVSGIFGGNSNWRGPVWFPLNYLLIDALRTFETYYNGDLLIEYPTSTTTRHSLTEIADDLARRCISLYMPGLDGTRPAYGEEKTLQAHPHWCHNHQFFEYFHGDTGMGLGASHQTGWTGLIANLIQEVGPHDVN